MFSTFKVSKAQINILLEIKTYLIKYNLIENSTMQITTENSKILTI